MHKTATQFNSYYPTSPTTSCNLQRQQSISWARAIYSRFFWQEHENDSDFKDPLRLPEGATTPMDVDEQGQLVEGIMENPTSVKEMVNKDMLKVE